MSSETIAERAERLRTQIRTTFKQLTALRYELASIQSTCPHERTEQIVFSMDFSKRCLDCGRELE